MQIRSVKLIYLSPTQTTESILRSIAEAPLAPGRPDDRDAAQARAFGARIRVCPEDALSMDDPALRDVVNRLRKTCVERREPETFL